MIRRYQKGNVRKKNGNYVLRYREDFIKPDGTKGRQQRTKILGPVSVFRGKKDARRAADEIMREINRNAPKPQASISLGEFWDTYFKPNILDKMKRNTRMMYQDRWRKQIAPVLSREQMRGITSLDLDRLMAQLQRQGYSWQTRVHIRNVISKMFSTAQKWKWLAENPARWVDVGQRMIVRKQRALSVEEVQLLAQHLSEPARTVFILAVTTGLRIGEVLGLGVDDLNLSDGIITVQRSVSRGEVETTKTEGSNRQVPIPSILMEVLDTHLKRTRSLSGTSPAKPLVANWLFASRAGTPLSDRNLINRHVYPVSRKLGIPHFSWHSLRHTFSTLGGNEGTIPTVVMKQLLGHSKLSTTQKYMHELKSQQREAMRKIENLIWFPKKKASGE
ncbi:MAG TPA: site-specific integrase [Terriglobia bacterium]|nr:site-specific integrase [Terriglobia bacterium]